MGIKWSAIDFDNMTLALNHTVVQGPKKVHTKDSTKNKSSNVTVPLVHMIALRLKEWKAQQAKYKALQPNDYTD